MDHHTRSGIRMRGDTCPVFAGDANRDAALALSSLCVGVLQGRITRAPLRDQSWRAHTPAG